jgi:hypothetical protein
LEAYWPLRLESERSLVRSRLDVVGKLPQSRPVALGRLGVMVREAIPTRVRAAAETREAADRGAVLRLAIAVMVFPVRLTAAKQVRADTSLDPTAGPRIAPRARFADSDWDAWKSLSAPMTRCAWTDSVATRARRTFIAIKQYPFVRIRRSTRTTMVNHLSFAVERIATTVPRVRIRAQRRHAMARTTTAMAPSMKLQCVRV